VARPVYRSGCRGAEKGAQRRGGGKERKRALEEGYEGEQVGTIEKREIAVMIARNNEGVITGYRKKRKDLRAFLPRL